MTSRGLGKDRFKKSPNPEDDQILGDYRRWISQVFPPAPENKLEEAFLLHERIHRYRSKSKSFCAIFGDSSSLQRKYVQKRDSSGHDGDRRD